VNFVLAKEIGKEMFIFVTGRSSGAVGFVGNLLGASRFESVEEVVSYRKWMGLSAEHFHAHQIASDGRIVDVEPND
jgi:hypothetical protein